MATANQIETLIVHRLVVVRLPAHSFTAHPLQRMTLTGRHMSRVRPGTIIAARIASQVRTTPAPRVVLEDCEPRHALPWNAIASFLLIVIIISAALAYTTI